MYIKIVKLIKGIILYFKAGLITIKTHITGFRESTLKY